MQKQPQKTTFIGLKEFRQGISDFTAKANKYNRRYIVLKRNVPVLDVRPLTKKEQILIKLEADIAEARQQVKEGKTHSTEEVMAMLGLS